MEFPKNFISKQGIERLAFNELQFFHFPFGVEYTIGDTIEYEEQLPNMLGGNPIKADARLFIESVDFDNDRCVLIQQMKLNPDDTKELLLDFFKRMGLEDRDMREAVKNAKFDVVDNNRFEYFYFPGVPIRVETERLTIIDIMIPIYFLSLTLIHTKPLHPGLFSNASSPRGHTVANTPQSAQDDRMMFFPRGTYQCTSIPISQ